MVLCSSKSCSIFWAVALVSARDVVVGVISCCLGTDAAGKWNK